MSSKAEREATAIFLLVDSLVGATNDPVIKSLQSAVERVRPFTLEVFDRAMKRVQGKMLVAINEMFQDVGQMLDLDHLQGYLHMLTSLLSDQWEQCPESPPERKRAWRRLNNAVVDFLHVSDGSGEVAVEQGCLWADRIREILRRA